MNTLTEVFGRNRVFLPVIHPITADSARASIATAVECGADGIFLIDQGLGMMEIISLIGETRERYGKIWIGVNFLSFTPENTVLAHHAEIDGIWSDNAGIDERSESQPVAERFLAARNKVGWKGLYFGGVAFKYQRQVPEGMFAEAARKASPWMDVITSSGDATGSVANIEKVKLLRAGSGNAPLALASGISPENVVEYLPYVDAYLVASSIETAPYSGILIPERTRMLAEKIHG